MILNSSLIDVCFVIPSSAKKAYQKLSDVYSAIEPPTWALILAQSLKVKKYTSVILDFDADRKTLDESVQLIIETKARLIVFVLYGQNPNSGTTLMIGASELADQLKKNYPQTKIGFIGSHVSALPLEVINLSYVDFAFINEGIISLIALLETNLNSHLEKIPGIWFKDDDGVPRKGAPGKIVQANEMDVMMPGYAWDLLPYNKKPFDLYRSPMWHAEYLEENRSPYAAIQTSLGCQFKCSFCMINLINRSDDDEIGVAGNYNKMRFWSPEFIIKEFDKLLEYGVKTIRIVDEMFLLNPKYYVPLCKMLSERNKNNELKMWAYSRIDTIKRKNILKLVRDAGIKWLCLGIESGDKKVRLEVAKGKFEDVDVEQVVNQVHESDIEVMANYIFGLPGDTINTMQKTFDLSMDLCTVGWNAYAAMALPGSQLYKNAIENNISLPDSYEGFSFHSYESLPLPTETLTPEQILEFRDKCFLEYHKSDKFLKKVEKKFGKKAIDNIKKITSIKLKRKILEKNY